MTDFDLILLTEDLDRSLAVLSVLFCIDIEDLVYVQVNQRNDFYAKDGVFDFSIAEAAAIGIIGGADGPTAIYVAGQLAPHLLGAIAVSAYSYMALVPIIQPPIMKLLTNEVERRIEMRQLRSVSKAEKIVFPLMLLVLVALMVPSAAPLLGMFCFGNLMRECGVVDRLNFTTQNALINITTIFLGLAVGSKLQAEKFLVPENSN